ncbi:MAG: transglycosylase domain-containing protein [Propioniciclava sp.]|uniref:transglycosylase domain-containing protein n=1 Tax=Propioniciclava sp. TaxID=2038686 RepID=UPI0039E56FAD
MADPKDTGTRGGARRSKRGDRPRTAGDRALSVFKWIGIVALALAVLGGGVFGVIYATTRIPDPNEDFQTNVTTVYYRDGSEKMGEFAVHNRRSIPLSEMPENVKQAVVAGENESFWTDPGISLPGLMRAVQTALTPGVDTVGGSTITQQYVKVLYLTQDKKLTRKLTEIILSLKIGQDMSKGDILAAYLNTVYYGRGAYGIQAAAQAYFGIDAKDLNLQQAVSLASVINSPNNLDPARGEKHAADLLERYQYTLNQMVKVGYITEAEKDEIYFTLPDFPKLPSDSRFGGPKGFLLFKVEKELQEAGFTPAQIRGGGLSIVTTVDARMQEAAVKAAQNMAQRIAKPRRQDPLTYNPALASIDTKTGGILAMYGGADATASADQKNWAEVPRPTGSTFKPWALVAGLRDGATLYDRFNGNEFTPRGGRTPVTNGGRNYGPVTLEKATTSSINSAYVDLVRQMKDGPAKVLQVARDVGITTPMPDEVITDRVALGMAEVSPLEAARGLATLVNEGKRTTPHIVAQVKDLQGKVIYEPMIAAEQTIDPVVAQNAVHALTGVVQDGTATSIRALGHQVAGKTGTYYNSAIRETKATWFIGSTKQISTAVVLTVGPTGYGNLGQIYGSTYAAPGWLEYMRVAMKDLPKERFPGPAKQKGSGRFTAPAAPRTSKPSTSVKSTAPSASSAPKQSAAPATPPPSAPAENAGPATSPAASARPTRSNDRGAAPGGGTKQGETADGGQNGQTGRDGRG